MPRIVRFHRFGGPEVLQLDDLPLREPGPGELRIAVSAIGLNRVETMFRCGYFAEPRLPSILGYEAAGTVDAIGTGVTAFGVGDRVAVLPGLSMEQYGTYGESILCPQNMLVAVADQQSLTEAAATWMQYLTAYGMIASGGLAPGQTVIITAASSSVGLAAIQIANWIGAVPVAVTRGRSKASGLQQAGAAHVIISEEQDLTQRVNEISAGRGVELVFDAVGGAALGQLLQCLAPGGCAVVYGALAGAELSLMLTELMLNNLSLRGFAANALLESPDQREKVLSFINSGIESGALKPIIDRSFPLDNIVEAHRYLESNTQLGKIVVTVDQ